MKAIEKIHDLGLLGLRLWVAQEFLGAGYKKLSGGIHAPEWFSGLQFPFPLHFLGPDLNWVAAGLGEVLLGAALMLGIYSRLVALGLLYITFVAIYTVHFDLGWTGWNQIDTEAGLGFKVPLMLALMLFTILTQGSGRYSIDERFLSTKKSLNGLDRANN
ncbi:DoxX family protein [Methylobacillus gramineus]|uniref:DoxX family protein n=1 Tax=Methylobacillus gramineus TaxID=755169 RepID=UPI001D001369|nr:DoxX family protein [Methylobacillus gramineus]MCB5185316.1 DoxX family protein [Methylobacillus gramineus]